MSDNLSRSTNALSDERDKNVSILDTHKDLRYINKIDKILKGQEHRVLTGR